MQQFRFIRRAYDAVDFFRHRIFMQGTRYWNALRRSFRCRNPRSILVYRAASVGDIVRATAIVRILRARHPEASIDFLTSPSGCTVLQGNPDLHGVHALRDIDSLGQYDWVINLQAAPPPKEFTDSAADAADLTRKISSLGRFVSGPHHKGDRVVQATNAFYCLTEFEELFLIALLKYSPHVYPETRLWLHGDESASPLEDALDAGLPRIGIFIGTNSFGPYDGGFRTYSVAYVMRLADHLRKRFQVVIVGESRGKFDHEIAAYRDFVQARPNVVDLVDKTSLRGLLQVVARCNFFISCDSGPLHIAMGLRVPTLALYVNTAEHKLCPTLRGPRYVALNALPACDRRTWRWKFPHLEAAETQQYFATLPEHLASVRHPIDLIDFGKIDDALGYLGAASK